MAIQVGEERYLQLLSHSNYTLEASTNKLFDDIFITGKESVRQPEFYGNVYKKLKRMLNTLSVDDQSQAAVFAGCKYPTNDITPDLMISRETRTLANTHKWLFEQTLTNDLVGTILTGIFPVFLFNVFDHMKISESKYEQNEFSYLYYLSVLKPLLDRDAIGANNFDKMKSTICRWWLFYAMHTFEDEAKSAAIDFISKLELSSASTQVNHMATYDAIKVTLFRLKTKIREHVLRCLDEGTGNAVYEYVRRFLDEMSMVRHAHHEVGRVELKIDNLAESDVFKINVTDRSKWLQHKKRIADSFCHQMYSIGHNGILEPALDTREISSFITGNYAFSAGAETLATLSPDTFMAIALDPRLYIDTNRISPYINENGMSIPNMVESLSISYNAPLKDIWFSCNMSTNLNSAISAMDLQHKMNLLHLNKGAALKLCGEDFTFDSAVIAELGMKICQRFWALVIPETSVTGNLQISYDNAFGTPLIEGADSGINEWYSGSLVKGLETDLYNNITPIVSFLDALKIDSVAIDRSNNLLIGKELLLAFYAVLKSFGIETLKTQMISWLSNLTILPSDRQVYPEWTSAVGQANATKRFTGFGNCVMEHQCIKSLFNATNSSQLNNALVKTLSIIIAYKTDAIAATPIIQVFKD